MKKVLSYLTVLSLLVMLIFVPSINAEAAQSRTINLGRLGLGQTVNRSLGIKLETPGSFGSRTLGGGLQLAEDPTGMLMVRGTTNAYGNVNVTVNGVRCLTNPSNPSSGDSFDFTINFEVSSQVPYRINYVDQGTGVVVFSEEGRASADNTWVNIRTEFHHSGSTYAINKAQSYLPTQYKYATASNAAQVYVASASAGTDGYVTYNLVSYKKAGTTLATPSSAGSSSSSTTVSVRPRFREGWILKNDEWYYYTGGSRTNLKKGWHKDSQDGFWYYLNGADGRMLRGWNNINDEWYYLTPYTPMQTWELRSDGEWYYMHKENSRPLGSMYIDEKTPDGYKVDSGGKYVK